jgi:hypothetical protein
VPLRDGTGTVSRRRISGDAPNEDEGYDAMVADPGARTCCSRRETCRLIVVAVGLSSFGDVLGAVALTIRFTI